MGNPIQNCTWSSCDCPEKPSGGPICKFENPDAYADARVERSKRMGSVLTGEQLHEQFQQAVLGGIRERDRKNASKHTATAPGTLTEHELKIITALGAVWNDYLELGETASDKEEFMNSIHALQRQVMARLARRVHPDVFQSRWR